MSVPFEIQTINTRFNLAVLALEKEHNGRKAHVRNVQAAGLEMSSGHYYTVLFTTPYMEFKNMRDALDANNLLTGLSDYISQEAADRDDMLNVRHVNLSVLRQQLQAAQSENVALQQRLDLAERRYADLQDTIEQMLASA